MKSHHIVGSWEKWSISKAQMEGEDSLSALPCLAGGLSFKRGQRVTLRTDAPKAKGSEVREEFQIVGNKSWDLRFYPAGGDKEAAQGFVPMPFGLCRRWWS